MDGWMDGLMDGLDGLDGLECLYFSDKRTPVFDSCNRPSREDHSSMPFIWLLYAKLKLVFLMYPPLLVLS
jgi:hypothetical protein